MAKHNQKKQKHYKDKNLLLTLFLKDLDKPNVKYWKGGKSESSSVDRVVTYFGYTRLEDMQGMSKQSGVSPSQ